MNFLLKLLFFCNVQIRMWEILIRIELWMYSVDHIWKDYFHKQRHWFSSFNSEVPWI